MASDDPRCALDLTSIVVEYGADPNAVDDDGLSSLHYACTRGNLPCVEALCQAGADPNIETCPMTPLMMAAAQGHDQVVQALVKCGANVNGKTRAKGQTVLHIACEHEVRRSIGDVSNAIRHVGQRFSTVDILLANGASINEVDAEGASALIGAISRGQPQMVIHLLSAFAPRMAYYLLAILTSRHYVRSSCNSR